jgi:hypothetical protein
MRVSKLIPSPVLRRIDRVREGRILAVTAPAAREYISRYGLEVRHGPFVGMRYPPGLEPYIGDLVAKLTGVYERELHAAIAEWVEIGFERVIDVGSAEGYYAVGFARAMPGTVVSAFDIDPVARERCGRMAALNGVAERVAVGGECAPSALAAFPEEGVALLSDCEGAERALLDPDAAPRLRRWTILVELHDFVDPTISETVLGRFRETHEIEVVEMEDRDEVPSELDFATPHQLPKLLSERPPGMRWAHMRPRAR